MEGAWPAGHAAWQAACDVAVRLLSVSRVAAAAWHWHALTSRACRTASLLRLVSPESECAHLSPSTAHCHDAVADGCRLQGSLGFCNPGLNPAALYNMLSAWQSRQQWSCRWEHLLDDTADELSKLMRRREEQQRALLEVQHSVAAARRELDGLRADCASAQACASSDRRAALSSGHGLRCLPAFTALPRSRLSDCHGALCSVQLLTRCACAGVRFVVLMQHVTSVLLTMQDAVLASIGQQEQLSSELQSRREQLSEAESALSAVRAQVSALEELREGHTREVAELSDQQDVLQAQVAALRRDEADAEAQARCAGSHSRSLAHSSDDHLVGIAPTVVGFTCHGSLSIHRVHGLTCGFCNAALPTSCGPQPIAKGMSTVQPILAGKPSMRLKMP